MLDAYFVFHELELDGASVVQRREMTKGGGYCRPPFNQTSLLRILLRHDAVAYSYSATYVYVSGYDSE
jgi:hypothetical protein